MQIKECNERGIVILEITGEVNIDTIAELKKIFDKLLEGKPAAVLLNLKGLDYIDSSGLACLIEFTRALKGKRREVLLCELSSKIRSIFAITKLDKVFKLFDTQAEALERA
ncbi:STAS domain-containing protein [Candidatus Omnitrophota bacterium]